MTAEGRDPALAEYRTEVAEGKHQLRWRNLNLAEGVASQKKVDEIREGHRNLLRNLVTPETTAPMPELTARWRSARDVIQEEVVTLCLRQILPGQCRLCPGGEANVMASSTGNRRRND